MQLPFSNGQSIDISALFSQDNELFYRHLVELTPEAVVIHAHGKVIFANPTAYRLIGAKKPSDLIGQPVTKFLHPEDLDLVKHRVEKMIKTGKEAPLVEERFIKSDGEEIHTEVKAVPFVADGETAILAVIHDITDRKHAEIRQKFLSRVNMLLSSSLDYEETLQNISTLTVPNLADYFRLAIVKPNGEVQEITSNHSDTGKVKYVRKLYESYKDRSDTRSGVNKILSSGKPEMICRISNDDFKFLNNSNQIVALVKKLRLKSYMGVPLIVRKQTIGAMTFSSSKRGRFYTEADLRLAQEFAARIALALENARLYKEAKEAVTLRDDFISIASHELRTPVTSLKIYAQMLYKKFRRDASAKEIVSRMNHQMESILSLVNDLLNVSRIQRGRLEVKRKSVDLLQTIQQAVDDIKTLHPGHSIEIEQSLKAKVIGDSEKIGQVLINLLTNAIKYSPDKKKIIIKIERDRRSVIVSVRDFGIGIDKEHQLKIFRLFYRATDKNDKTFPGLGVGLYISAQIISRHGGKMWVESKKGKGSTFFFSLPHVSSAQSANWRRESN